MLLFSSNTFTVDGVTVFPDHADPNQFWYLPAPVGLAKAPDSDEPQFLLIMYAPDVASGGAKGVGFLNVTLALKISDETEQGIMGHIRSQFPDVDNPTLAPVPFDEGTVQIVTLDMQGSGGATNTAPPGAFQAVQHILGAVSPGLFGDNNALFALSLTADGASILEAAFDQGMAPVGAIYNLKFTGVRPALDVKITADLKRCYQSFSASLNVEIYWVSAGLDATFEKLRQDGAIKVEVVSLASDAGNQAAEQQAMAMFKDQILSTWFTPSLSPGTAAAADVGLAPIPSQPGQGAAHSTTPSTTLSTHPSTTTMGGVTPPPTGSGMQATPHPSTAVSSALSTALPAAAHPSTVSAPGGMAASNSGPAGGIGGAAGQVASAANAIGSAAHAVGAGGAAGAAGGGAAGAVPHPPAPPGAASGASSAASPFGAALRLKYVSQDEQKTVTYEYNRQDAVQRTYAPQGFFGLMLKDIDRDKHFLKVDGVDPFFTNFIVNVSPPRDFGAIGLQTVHVALDYSDAAHPGQAKHGEFIFDATNTAAQDWSVFQGLIRSTEFTYTADYTFDPEAGWAGEQDRYQLPAITSENRQLVLDPRDQLGFLDVSVSPGHIDPDAVDHIDVALRYKARNGWGASSTITVRPGSPPQAWKVRISDNSDDPTTHKSAFEYSYSTTCTLKSGAIFHTDPVTTTARAVIIDDPFTGDINLTVQPTFDATTTKLAIVEITYQDGADYAFEDTLQLQPGSAAQHVRIPVRNRTQNTYAYRITTIDTANQRAQGAYVQAQDPLVLVGATP